MKKGTLIIIICIFIAAYAKAQNNKLYIYAELGFGVGNFFTGKIAVDGIYKKYCFGIGYYGQSSIFNKMPSDAHYSGDMPYRFPMQHLRIAFLTGGRAINTGCSKVRFMLKGGIGVGSFSDPVFKKGWGNNTFSIDNYSVTFNTKSVVGIVLNPTIEFPVSNIVGFSLGFWSNLNTGTITYGGETGIVFGRLRNHIKRASKYRLF